MTLGLFWLEYPQKGNLTVLSQVKNMRQKHLPEHERKCSFAKKIFWALYHFVIAFEFEQRWMIYFKTLFFLEKINSTLIPFALPKYLGNVTLMI